MNATSMIEATRRSLLWVEVWGVVALLMAGVVIGPYFLVTLEGAGRTGAFALLATGATLAVLLVGPLGGKLLHQIPRTIGSLTLVRILLFGAVAQIAVAVITQPIPTSDGKVYLFLAEKLANGLSYQDHGGHRAFWPPGLPFFLAPFVGLFGAGLLAIAAANVALFCIGATSAALLGSVLFERRVGLLAALLFTVWPSRLLTAGVASKENLTIAAMLTGTALCIYGLKRQTWAGTLTYCAGAGLSFGIAGMAQPGLLLFVFIIPLSYRYFMGESTARYLAACIMTLACAGAALVPWQLRNCEVFEGNFCGVATNGGSVFYRANNPLATGEWTPEGQVPITHLPELDQNRLGFQLGKQWILENPKEFLTLGVKKLGLLLRDDRYGAYWAVLRGTGAAHSVALQTSSRFRLLMFHSLNILSWVFWVLIISTVARMLISKGLLRPQLSAERLLPLLYPLLYCAAVFFVFESDRRQHMIALALLIIVAAWTIVEASEQNSAKHVPAARKNVPSSDNLEPSH